MRPLGEKGNPLVEKVPCPLSSVPATLAGKDWTRYEGLLHTDHAVREEFFLERAVAPTASRPYLMDFTYLFDASQADFEEFSRGKRFSDEEVYAEIGHPADWTHRAAVTATSRSEEQAARVAEQLVACSPLGSASAVHGGSRRGGVAKIHLEKRADRLLGGYQGTVVDDGYACRPGPRALE